MMELNSIPIEEENEQQKEPTPLDESSMREAIRTFLRVKKRVEFAKAQKNVKEQITPSNPAPENSSVSIKDEKFTDDHFVTQFKKDLNPIEYKFEKIITLLIEASEKNRLTKDLFTACKDLNMTEIEYINFDNDPMCSKGYNLIFNCYSEIGKLEIIDSFDTILQSGFQIIYTKQIFSKRFRSDFKFIKKILKNYYSTIFVQSTGGTKLYNFANSISQCYMSKSKVDGKNVINFRIMNKEYWRLINNFFNNKYTR